MHGCGEMVGGGCRVTLFWSRTTANLLLLFSDSLCKVSQAYLGGAETTWLGRSQSCFSLAADPIQNETAKCQVWVRLFTGLLGALFLWPGETCALTPLPEMNAFILVYRELSPSHFFSQTHFYIVKTSLDDDYWS